MKDNQVVQKNERLKFLLPLGMSKQYQHIVPQTYLRKFGYQLPEFNNRWFVSVRNLKKNKWEKRDIKRFLGQYNLYDVVANENISKSILEEDLHGDIEKRINSIIEFIEANDVIPHAKHLDLAETVANFIGRSLICLKWKENITQIQPKAFWDNITHQHNIFEDESQRTEIYDRIMSLPEKERRNHFMIFYMLRVKNILSNMNLTVFRNLDSKFLFTSDNPVFINNEGQSGFGTMMKEDTEIYFPLTKDLLVYFYWVHSNLPTNCDDSLLVNKTIQTLDLPMYNHFSENILSRGCVDFIISPVNHEENLDDTMAH